MIKKVFALTFAGIAFVGATFVLYANREFTAPIRGEHAIARMDRVELGGLEQFVLIRGVDVRNPLLLIVHGGPGAAETPLVREHLASLEKHFTVVNWDQRGAGKSYSPDIDPKTMNREQFVADAIELIEHLTKRFERERVYLLGHSWGSLIGVSVAQKRPDLLHAYIGTGQIARMSETEPMSYHWTLAQARERGDASAVAELEAIGPPPYGDEPEDIQKLLTQRQYLFGYGGSVHGVTSVTAILLPLFWNDEYNLGEKLAYVDAMMFSTPLLWPELRDADLFREVPALDVPVYLAQGRHDRVADSGVAKRWFDALRAPRKDFQWFEHSAHSPAFEEPEAFTQWMESLIQDGRHLRE